MTTAGSGRDTSNHCEQILDTVRKRIAPEDSVLKAARERRDAVKAIAMTFPGTARAFNSGSVAHATANNPVSDADCGVVLDRRSHSALGPDGAGVGPVSIINEMVAAISPELKKKNPKATVETTKRAILVKVHEPIGDEDPSVDLIVALTRRTDDALWIPQLLADRWDPSDPERHTALLTADPGDLRVHRARVLRLAKAAVCNDGDARVMCSFNIEALALTYVVKVKPTLGESLELLFTSAAISIKDGLTPDPAGVSGPIKLPDGVSQEDAAQRLAFFAGCMKEARAAASRADAFAALSRIYGPQLRPASPSAKSMIADALRRNERGAAMTAAFGAAAATMKSTRSFGEKR